ncbi:MAG: MFS transporter [Eubacteriaceae bacterium]|jgi:Na+/melibiose symporter-like transporter|nr:MFS transporter [Eubacteriaceae bacterium]
MSDNKAAIQIEQEVTIPKYIPWVYLIYSILNGVSSTMALVHLQFYSTEYTGVSVSSFVAVVTIARFADLAVSLISGAIVQRQARVRPWVIGCYTVSQIGTIMCFLNPPVSVAAKLGIIVVFYCFIHFPMNFVTVASSTLLIKVAGPNQNNRLAISAMQQRGMSIIRIASSAITVPLITYLNTILPNGRGYFIVTCIFAAMTFAGNIILFIATKQFEPKDSPKPTAAMGAQTNIFKMYANAMKSVPTMVLLCCSLLTGIGGQVLSAGLQYYWRFSVGNMALQAFQGTVAGFVSLGLAMFCPAIAKKIGNKNSSLFMYAWFTLTYAICFFFADGNPWLYMVVMWVQALGMSIAGAWGQNLWISAAEVQLYETGIDNRPFIMSLSNLPIKFGFIASGPFVSFMLNNTGYEIIDGVGVMSDTSRFVKIWLIIPMLSYILAGLLFAFGYKVDPIYAQEAAAENKRIADERRAAAEAAS